MAPFDGRPPNVLVLGGGGLLGEAWMTGVLAGYEDATGADVRRCRRFVGTSAGSIVASSLVAGRSPRRPRSAEAGADPSGRGPRWCAVAVRGPRSGGATGTEHLRRRRSGRRPARRTDPRARAAGPSRRTAVDRRLRGRGRPLGRDLRRAPARMYRRRGQRSPRRVRQPVGASGFSRAGGCGVLRDPGGLRAGAHR